MMRVAFLLALICLISPAAAAERPRLLGLLELPALFGSAADQNAIRAIPLQLHSEPGLNAPVVMEIERPEQLDSREYAPDAEAAAVYGRRRGWSRLRSLTQAGEVFGWLAPEAAGHYRPLFELLDEGIAYLTAAWDGHLLPAPGMRGDGSVRAPRPQPEIRVLQGAERDGELWLEVELLEQSPCEAARTPAALARGWLRAHTDSGEPVAWFHPRGC